MLDENKIHNLKMIITVSKKHLFSENIPVSKHGEDITGSITGISLAPCFTLTGCKPQHKQLAIYCINILLTNDKGTRYVHNISV